jgi:HK97 family phage major capsid protein
LLAPMLPKNSLDTTSGGSLIQTTLLTNSFIEMLRNKSVIMQLARQLTGLVGNVDIPKQTAGASAYWVGEDSAPAASNATFGNLQLRMKTIAANTYLTRTMLKQSSIGLEAFAREDIALALGLAIDKAAFYGAGSNNEPKGLSLTDGINSKTFAAANPTYEELVDMETLIGADNAAVDSMAYIVNATTKGHCKTTQKFPTNANGAGVIWEPNNQINGYNAVVTNQINTGDVFLGNFADFILGMFGGLEIIVDPYTYSNKGGVQITAFQDVDYGARHAASFCYGKKSA